MVEKDLVKLFSYKDDENLVQIRTKTVMTALQWATATVEYCEKTFPDLEGKEFNKKCVNHFRSLQLDTMRIW